MTLMATVALSRTGAQGVFRTARNWAVSAIRKALSPHRASLIRLAEMPLTVMGAGCIDAAAFAGDLIAGLVITGISLILVEHMIADEDEPGRRM